MYSKELLKGTLKTIVLKLLSENGKMYGYEITQKVKELTDSKILLTEGALYPTLHKLEAAGLIVSQTQNIGKRVRKYYSVTSIGADRAISLANEFVEFVRTMLLLLNPQLSKK
ncbi:PadR family transcriptional regulator [Reichenbachiella sp. MALMAid0571]|uniref:PadR family transcriptional regulator n=1 Tax=Reichenbachiella sp. MALMAid0571 TaxID=3143939 RepID=UPI0032DEB6D4